MKPKDKKLINLYDNSFDHLKKAWRHLVKAQELAGSKDFYYMVLRIQKEIDKVQPNAYRLVEEDIETTRKRMNK